MNNPSLKTIERMMDRSVAMVEKHARFVLVIDKHGFPISYYKKEPYGLNIIAVIGESVINDTLFPRVILMEIGIWRTKPYRTANAPMGYAEKRLNLKYRTKGGDLTDEQWGNLAPFINDIITVEASRVIEQWKSKKPWVVPVGDTWKTYEVGVCFSCSFKDHAFLETVIRADRKHRGDFMKKAALINYALRHLMHDSYSDDAIKRMASTQKVAESLREHPVPPYHFSPFEKRIYKRKRALFREVVEVFNLVDLEKVREFDEILKTHRRRVILAGASIRIKMEREQKGYLVFEFIPRKP